MIEFSNPSEEFKRKNPHIFGEEQVCPVNPSPSKADLQSEKRLQIQILNLLRQHHIEALWHRTDKKTTCNVGWPDFVFSVEQGLRRLPVCWEVKLPGGKLSPEQRNLQELLTHPPNSWEYRVITSVDEALRELKRYGLQ